jgi:hypothetical protein
MNTKWSADFRGQCKVNIFPDCKIACKITYISWIKHKLLLMVIVFLNIYKKCYNVASEDRQTPTLQILLWIPVRNVSGHLSTSITFLILTGRTGPSQEFIGVGYGYLKWHNQARKSSPRIKFISGAMLGTLLLSTFMQQCSHTSLRILSFLTTQMHHIAVTVRMYNWNFMSGTWYVCYTVHKWKRMFWVLNYTVSLVLITNHQKRISWQVWNPNPQKY